MIALGCLLAVAVRSRALAVLRAYAGRVLVVSTLLFVAAFVLGGLHRTRLFGRTLGYSIVAFTFAPVVLFTVLSRELRVTAPVRFPPLMYVGKICYDLYVLHRFSGAVAGRVVARVALPIAADGLVMLAFRIALSLVLATVSWHAFEKHLLRFKKWFESRNHPMLGERASPDVPDAARARPARCRCAGACL